MATWRRAVEQEWPALRFGPVRVETVGSHHAFEVQVFAHDLDLAAVRVELYAAAANGDRPVRLTMTRAGRADGRRPSAFGADMPATRPAADYTVRVIPYHEGVAVPLETPCVLWQR